MSEQAQGETKWRLGELTRVGPRALTSWSRERGQAAAPTRKWRTTSSHDSETFVDVVQKIHSQRARVDDFVQRKGQVFFVVITASVDGKEA